MIMGKGKGIGVVALDLAFMSVAFSPLPLFSALKADITKSLHLTPTISMWAAVTYSIGIFFAFLLGHSKSLERRPRITMLLATLCAAVPQFIIPYSNAGAIIPLRFIQGLTMMIIPIFSAEVGLLFVEARPLAVGIILAGIFIGGFVGADGGITLASSLGWKGAFVVLGILILILGGLLIGLTPRDLLRREEREEEVKYSVWRDKFTIAWGFTLFPALWIIFTLAPLINYFLGEEGWRSISQLSLTLLQGSYIFWSIVIGLIAYVWSKAGKGNPKRFFTINAKIQTVCYAITVVALIAALLSRSAEMLLVAIFFIATIQGAGPTFWSTPGIAYPKELITRAGYAMGLIANSATLVGPLVTMGVRSMASNWAVWYVFIGVGIAGAIMSAFFTSRKIKLPIEKYNDRTL